MNKKLEQKNILPQNVISSMLKEDQFSKWLGLEIVEISEGYCKLRMKVRKEMLNGFEICHGGIIFSLADSALAFASNSYGKIAVSVENSISFISKVKENDILTVETKEISKSNKIAVYNISITNQENELAADFKGTVYITEKNHKE